jgi:hypothetical protein
MDFVSFMAAIDRSQCVKWTPRQKRLEAYSRALHGKMYSHLPVPFSQERSGNGWSGERALLDSRRPSVQDRLPMELVRDFAGMLFGESHRPVIVAKTKDGKPNDDTSAWIQAFIKDTDFWLMLVRVLWSSSIGAGCVVLRVLGEQETGADGSFTPKGKGAYHVEVWPAYQCKPVFRRTSPSNLKQVERIYFSTDDTLAADGYDVVALTNFWNSKKAGRGAAGLKNAFRGANKEWALRCILDEHAETWYQPVPKWMFERNDWSESDWVIDPERTAKHDLQEVPALWVRPLPLDDDSLYPDGLCIFDSVIDFQFRIDRTLSQVGRAFDYAGDPQMARIAAKAGGGGGAFGDLDEELSIGGTASDVVDVGPGGDVKFIEARGDALQVAIDIYVKALRDVARENGAMSRITPDSGAAADMSAVAMKMLNYAQTVLADILRVTIGEHVGIRLIRMAMRMWAKVEIALPSYAGTAAPDPTATVEESWPDYYELHGQDKLFEVQATIAAVTGELIAPETGVGNTAGLFDVQDSSAEVEAIEKARDDAHARSLADTADQAAIAAQFREPSDSASTSTRDASTQE